MPNGLMVRNLWTFPSLRIPSLIEELTDETFLDTIPSGLSISEDDKNVYIEAAVPGLEPKDVEVTFEKGILQIRGEAQEEEKNRKFYRKATKSFSYRIAVPGEVDPRSTPEAIYKNGMMHVSFKKTPAYTPKKIEVKAS